MKKGLFLILLLACALPIIAGDGSTAQSPLTVSQALARKNDHKSYYVTGYVVGEYRDFSNNKHFYHLAPPFDGTSAYLIADDVDEPHDARTDKRLCRRLQPRRAPAILTQTAHCKRYAHRLFYPAGHQDPHRLDCLVHPSRRRVAILEFLRNLRDQKSLHPRRRAHV